MTFSILKEIKSFFTPNTDKVSGATNTDITKNTDNKTSVPMTSGNKETNTDKVEFKQNSRDKIYNKLAELCEEYRFSLKDAKDVNLLEIISGKDDITTLSEEELESVFTALKDALGITGNWKWLWQNRDKNDIAKIAENANARFTRIKTGGSYLGQLWHDITNSTSLKEAIGYKEGDNFEQKLIEHFNENYLKDIETLPADKKMQAYNKAFRKFGYFLNNATNGDKEQLVKIIKLLKAQHRHIAVDTALGSCKNDKEAKARVAFGIEKERRHIVSSRDAFNERPDEVASQIIAHQTFGNMDEKGTQISIERLNKESEEIKSSLEILNEKKNNGTISTEELIQLEDLECEYNNYSITGYSGALSGLATNKNISFNVQMKCGESILNQSEKLNILDEILEKTSKFMSTASYSSVTEEKAFFNNLNKATNNRYSEVLNSGVQANSYKPASFENSVAITNRNTSKNNFNSTQAGYVENPITQSTNNERSTIKSESRLIETNSQSFVTVPLKAETKVNTAGISTQNKSNTKINEKAIQNEDIVKVINTMGVEGLNKRIEKKGASATVIDVYNNIKNITDKAVILETEQIYKRLDSSRQAETLRHVSNSGLNELLKITSNEALKLLDGETFANYYATEQVENAVKAVNEKEDKNNLLV